MTARPSPCPRCGSPRAWAVLAAATEVPTAPVRCPRCHHEATACTRCGWETSPVIAAVLPAWTGTEEPCQACRILAADPPAPDHSLTVELAGRRRARSLQTADGAEEAARRRYRSRRIVAGAVAEAAQRDLALRRLEDAVRRLRAR